MGSLLGVAVTVATMQFAINGVNYQQGLMGKRLQGCTVVFRFEGNGLSHFNELGVRDTGNPKPGPHAHPTQIVVLGDSQTEGLRVDDQETFASVAERTLGPDSFRISNLATGGRALPDYIQVAPELIRKMRPDWTVIGMGDEDVTHDAYREFGVSFVLQGTELTVQQMKSPLGNPLFRNLGVLQKPADDLMVWPKNHGFDGVSEVLWRRCDLLNYRILRETPLFRAAHSATQERKPVDYPVEDELDLLVRAYHGRLTLVYNSAFMPGYKRYLTDTQKRVELYCQSHQVSFVSGAQEFQRLQGINAPCGFSNSSFNEGHLNRDGHRCLGEGLAREIENLRQRGRL